MSKKILNLIIIVFLLIASFVFLSRKPTELSPKNPISTPIQEIDPSTLPGIQKTLYPWPVEIAHLRDRLIKLGLPVLSEEGSALHTHQHLDIFVDGIPVPIPSDIGINKQDNFISPIHVHDDTGIIHIESPTVQLFSLGQFFDIWGVMFTQDCLGSYCNSDTKQLSIFVNGLLYSDNYRSLVLQPKQEIVVNYDSIGHIPSHLPSSYNFPADY